uniref:Uncharacterized protein n=1 Tax=Panagrolaimus sp. ES5 TaxID=591445 RepID=A0AC34GSN9_9BILA
MIYIANFVQKVNLSSTNKTIISFGENFVFAVALQKESFGFIFFIEIIKGVFEITNITATNPIGEVPIIYNKDKRTFYKSLFLDKDLEKITYTFYISANIELKEVCAVNYNLHVPVARLRLLKVYHYFKDEIVLPGYDGLKFTYFIKKIKNNESDGCDIELQVKNPYDVEIEGKKDDFVVERCGTKDIDLYLSFVFYPTILQSFNGNSTNVAKNAETPILHQHPALKTTPDYKTLNQSYLTYQYQMHN